MKKRFLWTVLGAAALFGFISIYRLLLPGDIPYPEIPMAAKVNTAIGVLGFFIASSGLGLLVAAISDVSLKLMRRQRPQIGRLIVVASAVGVGALMVIYYWNWLTVATAVSSPS